jgi:hypothetical protein
LAHLLRKSKNYGKEESGKRIFGMLTSGKKEVHFLARGVAKNVQA